MTLHPGQRAVQQFNPKPFRGWLSSGVRLMSQAAQRQGRSALLYGLASLLPPLAVLAFFTLYNRDAAARLLKE